MDWLQKHWKAAVVTMGTIVLTPITSKVVDHYFDVSILAALWSFLVMCWGLITAPVSVPIWALIALLAVTFVHVMGVVKKANARSTNDLNEDQQFVLHGIGICNTQHSHEPSLEQISEMCGLTLSVTERITDQLRAKGMMRWHLQFIRGQWGADHIHENRAQMTKAGRDYLLDVNIDPSNPDHNG